MCGVSLSFRAVLRLVKGLLAQMQFLVCIFFLTCTQRENDGKWWFFFFSERVGGRPDVECLENDKVFFP